MARLVGTGTGGSSDGRRRTRRILCAALAVALGLPLALYAGIRAFPPVQRLVAESVFASGHRSWAWIFATPSQLRAWTYALDHTPNLRVVTRITGSGSQAGPNASPGGGAGHRARPCLALQAVSGAHYRGWVLSVCNPLWLHVAVTDRLGTLGEQTSALARQAHALAAVNGGGFDDPQGQGTGGLPRGITVAGGHLVPGAQLDPTYYMIGFDAAGRLLAGKWRPAEVVRMGVREAVSFKPLLVAGGRPLITSGDGGWGVAPRAAIGQRADGTVLFAVIDGRQPGSLGATLRQVQDLMLREGAVTAANLDGGSSATLWYRGRVVNHPCCSPDGQRYVPTAWVVRP